MRPFEIIPSMVDAASVSAENPNGYVLGKAYGGIWRALFSDSDT